MAINLKKGHNIELNKLSTAPLTHVSVGLNWGQIKKKSFFGLLSSATAVDLDGSAAIFDTDRKLLDVVCFKKLSSWDGSVVHSGDDLTGDMEDDDIDNEVITIDFLKITPAVSSIVLFLNSYKGQDFAEIPYSKIRIYGQSSPPPAARTELAYFNLSADSKFAGNVSMVMGGFFLRNGEWKFQAIGEPVKAERIRETVEIIRENFL